MVEEATVNQCGSHGCMCVTDTLKNSAGPWIDCNTIKIINKSDKEKNRCYINALLYYITNKWS